MGLSQSREHSAVNVVVECASIVKETLPCVSTMACGNELAKRTVLIERATRQQTMIHYRCKSDVWFCLYHSVLELTARSLLGKDIVQTDIETMFDEFKDHADEKRAEYDLATQILMIIHQLLRLSVDMRTLSLTERWQVHDSISASVVSARQRFRFLSSRMQKCHQDAIKIMLKALTGIYDARPAPGDQNGSSKSEDPSAKSTRSRTRTKSRRAVISAPSEWSEED